MSGATGWLGLAAAPSFAAMAVLTVAAGDGRMAAICSAAHAPLTGMAPMYLLMSLFHAGPWLKRAAGRTSGSARSVK